MSGERIVLASASPRRRELLIAAGFVVEVRPADVDETPLLGEVPAAYVARLARAKTFAVSAQPEEVVLGADTTVVVDDDILAKPADDAEAAAMLRRLSSRSHRVLTGVCLRRGAHQAEEVEATEVWFDPLSESDIAAYVASGEPRDKAGAYAIQGRAARFIPRIAGSYSNVVGLPIATVWRCWRQLAPR
ncbi:MAG TPA: Maf family protein [Terriglobales bacterium]|nr:Maf family protein [Terriglobales bacterium]